jgi:H+/Cl- antiporter ClcA
MEINSLVQWLFKWWLILSGAFWGLVGALYFTVVYLLHRIPKEMK